MNDEFVTVAKRSDLPKEGMLAVQAFGTAIALYDVNGTVVATANACTHMRARLTEGIFDGKTIECPRHGARFDVATGEVRALPAYRPLPTYRVRVVGDTIQVAQTT